MTDPRPIEPLARFLAAAKAASYAADDDGRLRRLEDGGLEAVHEADGFTYRDRWYGEARFAGQEVVWRGGRAVWAMSFQGASAPAAPPEFPHFHKRALRRVPPDAPFRGPALYREGELTYANDWTGDLAAFRGVERVFLGDREIYRLEYVGGTLG
jgi:hypothetical protein